jgi:hypothetical protein
MFIRSNNVNCFHKRGTFEGYLADEVMWILDIYTDVSEKPPDPVLYLKLLKPSGNFTYHQV